MSLTTDLQRIAQRNKAKMVKVAQNSLMRIGGAIVAKSPVDSGRFKNNWMSAYGAPDESTTNSFAKTELGEARGAVVGRLKAKLDLLDTGQFFYFTNSLPYAERLEYGWSQQAPGGMVRLSVASWQSIVEDEIRKAK
jgi:hypothetical protein